ncbi:MAG: DUF4375 domain-containing protein [Candidatus Obscuribacterales bacterium]
MPNNSHHQDKPLWNDSWARTFPLEGNQEFAQLLQWLKQATPEQMYDRLKDVKDLQPALTICDHILFATERQGQFAALACFAKAKLSKGQRNLKDYYLSLLEDGVRIGKTCLPADHPKMVSAQRIIKENIKLDPDLELHTRHWERLSNHMNAAIKLKEMSHDKVVSRLVSRELDGWTVFYLTTMLVSEVFNGGFEQYFGNKQGRHAEQVIASFDELDSFMAETVRAAFAIFFEHRHRHSLSASQRTSLKAGDIVQASAAPGRFQGDHELYASVDRQFSSWDSEFVETVADYIRDNEHEFETLPEL